MHYYLFLKKGFNSKVPKPDSLSLFRAYRIKRNSGHWRHDLDWLWTSVFYPDSFRSFIQQRYLFVYSRPTTVFSVKPNSYSLNLSFFRKNWQKIGVACLPQVLSLTVVESKPDIWLLARFPLRLLVGPYIESGLTEVPLGRLTFLDSVVQPAFDLETPNVFGLL